MIVFLRNTRPQGKLSWSGSYFHVTAARKRKRACYVGVLPLASRFVAACRPLESQPLPQRQKKAPPEEKNLFKSPRFVDQRMQLYLPVCLQSRLTSVSCAVVVLLEACLTIPQGLS